MGYLTFSFNTILAENEDAINELGWQRGYPSFSFCQAVQEGIAPKIYCESTDPHRMVPVFLRPDWIGIVGRSWEESE